MRELPKMRVKVVHPYSWLWEPLESEPSFVLRSMFGTKVVYIRGALQLCFSAKEEPWRGLLVCTDKLRHERLIQEFPTLSPHPILPKWLYLPESADDFESVAERLVKLVKKRDERIGVVSKIKKAKKRPAR